MNFFNPNWLLAALLSVAAQDTTPNEPQGEEEPRIPLPSELQGDSDTDEIVKLFKEVDKQLSVIDAMLFDMGAGERPLGAPSESGLGDLLKMTRDSSQSVVKDIDKILELADKMAKQKQSSSSSSSGGSSGQQQPGKGQPKNQQSPEQQGQENKPGEEPQGEQPQDGEGEQPKPGEQPQDGKRPDGNQDSNETPENTTDGQTGSHPTGAGSQADGSQRWGELPERVRETFRNQGGDEAPLYYRDWIDSYYRHLNQRDG